MTDTSFISASEAAYLLDGVRQAMPYIMKMYAVYYAPEEHKLSAVHWQSGDVAPGLMLFGEDFDYRPLNSLRRSKNSVSWVSEKDLPFADSHAPIFQKDVFSELSNSILLLRLSNKHDHHYDLYYFFFNGNFTNFSLNGGDKVLDTHAKVVVGQMMYSFLLGLRQQRQRRIDDYQQYKTFLSRLRDKVQLSAARQRAQNDLLGEKRLEFASYVLYKLSHASGLRPVFSRAAEELIRLSDLPLSVMERRIEEAVDFALFSDSDRRQKILIIEDWHFGDMDHDITKQEEVEEPAPDSRYERTYALLNRMEKAANSLMAGNEKLTGTRLGQAMKPPVSAPAISDALKKHGSKIVSLMQQYPQRWPLIRSHFKPMVNVLENKSFQKNKTA